MPKSIKGTEPVIDPLQAAPRLNSGEAPPETFTEPAPARARVRRRRGQEPEVVPVPEGLVASGVMTLTQPVCPDGHAVAASMRFCPECGRELTVPGPLTCSNGHEVTTDARFCPTCGVPLAESAIFSGSADHRPRPEAELSEAERAERLRKHDQALRLGRENPAMAYVPGQAPSGARRVIVHFLVDGFGAFGNVWYRGQEIELWEGHPRWSEAQAWINLDTAQQYAKYGREVFRPGPWPGAQSYTAGAGRFQELKAIDGEGAIPQPTAEELARADEAERRRGRRVPMPLG